MTPEEIKKLQAKKKSLDRQKDWLKDYLKHNIPKEKKIKDARVSIFWRKSSVVIVADAEELPIEFQRITIEAKKTELKEAIKNGHKIDGVWIEENNNLQIK